MDWPKGKISWLESFPPDVWAYFVCYIPGEQLERLKMTGATLLSRRLKSPNVVKTIHLGRDYFLFKSFPRFLNDFPSLENLSFYSFNHFNEEWNFAKGLKIDSMPSGLRKLKFAGNWARAKNLFGEEGSTLKLCEHLPHLQTLNLMRFSFESYSWLTHCPQSLTKLALPDWDGEVELPPSLIHIKFDKVRLSASSSVSKFPPSLESLIVSTNTCSEFIVPLLPPSTRKLDLGYKPAYSDYPGPPQYLLEQLPKSLTWFTVPQSTEINFVTNPELTSHLPSTLTGLHLPCDFPCSAWSLLPQHLAELSFCALESVCTVDSVIVDTHGVDHEVPSIPFNSLPRTITMLNLLSRNLFCGPPTVFCGSFFPPHLTVLNISKIRLAPGTAKLLPLSLTYLRIGSLCERICLHLPDGLKSLTSQSTLVSPNLIKFLPKSLTDLSLYLPKADDEWYDYNTESFDWKDHSPLPSTLTSFDMPGADMQGDSFLFHQKLPNLIHIALGGKHLTDLSIPLLPPGLRELHLPYSRRVSGKSFKFLPRSLTCICLDSSDSIFDSEIEHLPRTLTLVSLKRAIHLTDLCIQDLPPHLETLYLQENSQITPSSFPHFPYPIRSFQSDTCAIFETWNIFLGMVGR